jgi:hypothetical protein
MLLHGRAATIDANPDREHVRDCMTQWLTSAIYRFENLLTVL